MVRLLRHSGVKCNERTHDLAANGSKLISGNLYYLRRRWSFNGGPSKCAEKSGAGIELVRLQKFYMKGQNYARHNCGTLT